MTDKKKKKEYDKNYHKKNIDKKHKISNNYYKDNKIKIIEKRKKYYLENKDNWKLYRKNNKTKNQEYLLKIKYGIDNNIYNKLLIDQNGVCAICLKLPLINKRLAVDHNHKNKKIRGLLCHNCNLILGNCKDSIEILIKAIKYLEKVNLLVSTML